MTAPASSFRIANRADRGDSEEEDEDVEDDDEE